MTDVILPGGPGDDGNGPPTGVQPIEINVEMERSFLEYAMSVIVQRALPDARDGLKPVHRRILYAMHIQNYRPDRPHVKCAKVTGETMAKFHPHGDVGIYDALVRMAQPFSLRAPLIDFHGNYGSPDFPAAASRYTECRLSQLALQMLEGIDEETVDMTRNYLNEDDEPHRLAVAVPQPAGQREPGDCRGHGDEYSSAQPGRSHRCHDALDRPP